MTIRFVAITVGALMAAAKLAPQRDPDRDLDPIDSLLHRNADAHADSPSAAVINVAKELADRIEELNASAEPPAESPAPVSTETAAEGEQESEAPAESPEGEAPADPAPAAELPAGEGEAPAEPAPVAEAPVEEAVAEEAPAPAEPKRKR